MRYARTLFRRATLTAALAAFVTALGVGMLASEASAQSIGSSMPAAGKTLPNATGPSASLSKLAGDNGTVVIFWSNQCRWTGKYESRVLDLARKYQGQGVQFVLINPNSASDFPKESLSASKKAAGDYPMPYLKDEGGQVAGAFGAKRTPQVYLFDAGGSLAYTGGIDDSPRDASGVKKPYLSDALQALASGSAVPKKQTNAFGCMIKN